MKIFTLLLVFLPFAVNSQIDTTEKEKLVNQILNASKTSDDLQLGYSWNSRVDVTKEGKVMDIKISQFKYDPEGKMIQTILNDEQASLPSSFLIHKIAEEEKDKIVAFLSGVHDLILQYYLRSKDKLLPFLAKAQIISDSPEGDILLSAENVVQEGDKMTWWISSEMYTTKKLSVSTNYESEKIEFTGTFTTLTNGLNYLAFGEIIIPSMGYLVQIHNYDYLKQD